MDKKSDLKAFFAPKSIAVIGASSKPGKVGNDVILNLKHNFPGEIYPVNNKEAEVEGLKAYASVGEIGKAFDLAIVIVPAEMVAGVMEECGGLGCHNVVVISAGFKEVGGRGVELENDIKSVAQKHGMRVLGPNCLGYISSREKVNASFARNFPDVGGIGFLSQSGALGTAVLDMSDAQKVGLSYFASLGNKMDISELDLMDFYAADKDTKVILAYLESINDGPAFIAKASEVTAKKPMVVLKAGKTADGSKAVSSHTGSLAGAAQAYSSAFKQSGVIEADDLEDFFALAKGFSLCEMPQGNRVVIVTNAGGPGILVTDLLPANGLKLAELSDKVKEELAKVLPAAASVHNPVDVLGDAKSDRYEAALAMVAKEKDVDAIIVVLTPQKMSDVEGTVRAVGEIRKKTDKAVLCCFLGEAEITKYYDVFAEYGLAQFNYPAQAVGVLGAMCEYGESLESKKVSMPRSLVKVSENVTKLMATDSITEEACRAILSEYDFPIHKAKTVADADEAVKYCQEIGYPVAVKVVSPQVVHKSDVGGVKINIKNDEELVAAISEIQSNINKNVPDAVIDGYLVGEMVTGLQVILGMKRDPQFGPLIMLGMGGIYTEVFKDVTFRVAPFGHDEAMRMISELKIYPLFKGARGEKPLDDQVMADLLVKFADFSLTYPEISEIDFNPIMVLEKGKGVRIVDVRMLK